MNSKFRNVNPVNNSSNRNRAVGLINSASNSRQTNGGCYPCSGNHQHQPVCDPCPGGKFLPVPADELAANCPVTSVECPSNFYTVPDLTDTLTQDSLKEIITNQSTEINKLEQHVCCLEKKMCVLENNVLQLQSCIIKIKNFIEECQHKSKLNYLHSKYQMCKPTCPKPCYSHKKHNDCSDSSSDSDSTHRHPFRKPL